MHAHLNISPLKHSLNYYKQRNWLLYYIDMHNSRVRCLNNESEFDMCICVLSYLPQAASDEPHRSVIQCGGI